MTRSVRLAASRNRAARAVVAFGAAAALFLVGLMTPGAGANMTFPFSQVSEIRYVTTSLCNLGTLGTNIMSGDTAMHGSPLFINVSDVERCVSARTLNVPNPLNPENTDIRIDSELFNYATVATSTGYGTRLMASITRFDPTPFNMSVDTTAGAAAAGEAVVASEVFLYDSKTATSFHITARAQRGSQAGDHSGGDLDVQGNPNANQARVYATGASGKTSSIQTMLNTSTPTVGTTLSAKVTAEAVPPFNATVASTVGAASPGFMIIDAEVFGYTVVNGTTLNLTSRALVGTTAAQHAAAATVTLPAAAVPFNINVGSTAGAESSCGTPPCVLLIDEERFTYTVVDIDTFQVTGRGVSKSGAGLHLAGAQVFAPRQPPFELEVGDARNETGFDANSPNNPATGTVHHICLGTETLRYNPSATETVGDGLGGGADVILVTARGLDRVVAPFECGLITPRAIEGQPHAGTTIRDATRVQLLDRAMPEYDSGPPGTAVGHSGSTIVTPPEFNRCIGRSDRTVLGGPDTAVSRTRCYSRVLSQPSPPGMEDGSGPYFVSTNSLTDRFTFISESNGTFNDETNGDIVTILDVFLLGQCISVGSLHVEVRTTIHPDKTDGNTDYGSFNIRVWLNSDTCSGSPNYILGACDNLPSPAPQTATGACATAADGTNFSATPLAAGLQSDIDKDGCSDYRELADTAGGGPAGLRDPFNPYDYFDVNHDGAISPGVDVLSVARVFGVPARYVDYKDRGALLGPSIWNRGPPNGSVSAGDDVLAVARQFGHACPHTTHPSTTVFGAHPTTLYAAITGGTGAPFVMTLGTTSGFPASGMVLVDLETLTYDQTSCGAINTLTQVCVTARGSGTPAGNVAADHHGAPDGSGAVVYPKP